MKLPLFFSLLAVSQLAVAETNLLATCNSGATERLIEVVYPTGNALPCQVVYTKAGTNQVLWSARNQRGYCEQKAVAFVEKQRGWGWLCTDLHKAETPAAIAPEMPAVESVSNQK